jgi:uncharacterized membrane protein
MTTGGAEEAEMVTASDPFERAVRSERERRRRRHRRLVAQGFRVHVAVFVTVQLLLFVTWWVTTPGGFPWFVFPFFGWGIGLAAHGFVALSRT